MIATKSNAVMDQTNAGLDIFARLTQQKKEKVERKRQKQIEEEKENNVTSSNTKTNARKSISEQLMNKITYDQRQNRGHTKLTYNSGVNKIPGLYNPEGRIHIQTDQ